MNISVIIPAFNAEKTIKKCIDSILNNNRVSEIIIVDDGSKDKTRDILFHLSANGDNRLVILEQENQGPAIARLTGLKHVRNEYVTFLDADDYLADKAYDMLLQNYDISQFDIVECGYDIVSDNGDLVSHSRMQKRELQGKACSENFINGKSSNYLWNKFFKLKLFEGIITPQLYYSEDACWLAQLFLKANSYKCVDVICCNHVINPQSLCEKPYNSHSVDQITAWSLIRKLYIEENKQLIPAIDMKLCSLAIILYAHCNERYEKVQYLEIYKKYRKNLSVWKILQHGSFKRKMMILLFSISPKTVGKYLYKQYG